MQRRRVASALTAALAAVLAGGAGGAVFELAPLQTARVSVLDIDQESVDGASGAVAALMAGLVAGVDFANDGEVVPTPAKGGDSYGGDGNTFEPVFGHAKSTVILLHGLSARISQVVPIVPVAQTAGLTRTRFILPQAPDAYVNYRRKAEPSWMNMGGTTRGAQEFPDEIWATIGRIERIVAGERARGVQKVAVVRLSQGGAIAVSMYMVSNVRLDAVVGLSAWLPDAMAGRDTASAANANLPLLMVHGRSDRVIELAWSEQMIAVMRGLGRTVDAKVINGAGHTFGASLLTAARYTIDYLKKHGV